MATIFKVGDIVRLKNRDNDTFYTVLKVSKDGYITKVETQLNVLDDLRTISHEAAHDSEWVNLFLKVSKEEQDHIKFIKNHPNREVILKVKRMYERRKERGYAF